MLDKKTFSKAYIERDLSWMYFNHRILQEAAREDVPLLERIGFLGIYSNNLDEFFRVRVATLSRIAECENRSLKNEQAKAMTLIKQINKLVKLYSKEFEEIMARITDALAKENIFILREDMLSTEQEAFITRYFRHQLGGLIGPVWLSAVKQLTNEADDNIFFAVELQKEGKNKPDYAVIELPVSDCGRFVRLPDNDGKSYIMYLDDVVRYCLPMIFAGMRYDSIKAYAFKFTKDAEMELDNDLRNGMLQKISKGVKSRRKGEAMRVSYDKEMPKALVNKVMNKLNLDSLDTVLAGGRYYNHKDLMSFPDCGRNDLKYPAWPPLEKPGLSGNESLISGIQQSDKFIHVPYHSFDYYIRVLQEAAVSKQVTGIQTTLYRLAKNSKVVKALICAAKNGKKVTVVIELLARFDESPNIEWSKRMQDAGIHVIFGVEGLKVHSKITHIAMKNGNDIACISTGNFHEGNAKVYTDYMLMTAAKTIVSDVANVFEFIEKPYSVVRFKELLLSPNEMKRKFVKLINDEIRNKQMGKPAYIRIKINHITDPVMVRKLYEASQAGVDIDLLVRGNCSLKTGIPGVSDNIRIHAIIDRYLEHSRIFIFAAGGEDKTFIGSADWMPRNLDNRIEVVTPVYDPEIKHDLRMVVDFGLRDNVQGRIEDGTGSNTMYKPENEPPFRSQEKLYEFYKEQLVAGKDSDDNLNDNEQQ